jgi:hypothetical protein
VRVAVLVLPLLAACAEEGNTHVGGVPVDDPPRSTEVRPDIPGARELDQQGVRAYTEGRYEDAARLFAAAYRAGGPPSELWNIARCREKEDLPEAAATAISEYLTRAGLAEADRVEAERELRTLESRSSMVTVLSKPEGATVVIDGRSIGTTPGTFELHAGSHKLVLQRSGYAERAEALQTSFGRSAIVSLDLNPAGK